MKMYYYYGVMGSSKTANALMTKFNFEEHGKKVILMKPSIDDRDGIHTVKSRIGIDADAVLIHPDSSVKAILNDEKDIYLIVVDEAQFLSKDQVNELRDLVDNGISVMCYGLKTDFMGNLFEGSKRLLEVSDTIREIKSMCKCGRKAIINARYADGKIVYSGDSSIDIGGDDKYIALCYQCWRKGII
ncbi:thymidine kinase [Anaeromicropila herbilytica]|uniref:Thymidine kinase n=1 Tax=Anaeromicropila herbilytica TaxID=2785025 RepID=A0A7R7ICF4_9FIRM|nr:thymidine kinase [Anaeromicropila herbilytica]BCN30678.1 thymidine kinase [Anaeromicropila herbilytica]